MVAECFRQFLVNVCNVYVVCSVDVCLLFLGFVYCVSIFFVVVECISMHYGIDICYLFDFLHYLYVCVCASVTWSVMYDL